MSSTVSASFGRYAAMIAVAGPYLPRGRRGGLTRFSDARHSAQIAAAVNVSAATTTR